MSEGADPLQGVVTRRDCAHSEGSEVPSAPLPAGGSPVLCPECGQPGCVFIELWALFGWAIPAGSGGFSDAREKPL